MTEIYEEIAKLSDKFNEMAYGITTDKNKIDNAVQELMLYFLQMNPETLKSIYEKDGIKGIIKYGAVALRRALSSTRSNFFTSMKNIIRILTVVVILTVKLLAVIIWILIFQTIKIFTICLPKK